MKKIAQISFWGMLLLPLAGAGAAVTSATEANANKDIKTSAVVLPAPAKIQNTQSQQLQQSVSTPTPVLPILQPATTSAPAVLPTQQKPQGIRAVQLELELNKNTKYHIFSLSNPARLVVDIKNGRAITEFDKAALLNTPVIKNIRTALHENNTLRIVFDLKKDLTFTTKEEMLKGTTEGDGSNKICLVITLIDKKS